LNDKLSFLGAGIAVLLGFYDFFQLNHVLTN
jgi:hypothetical protein